MSKLDIVKNITPFQTALWMLDKGDRRTDRGYWSLCLASIEVEKDKLGFDNSDIVKAINEATPLNCRLKESDKRYIQFDSTSSLYIDKLILDLLPNDLDIIQRKIINGKQRG